MFGLQARRKISSVILVATQALTGGGHVTHQVADAFSHVANEKRVYETYLDKAPLELRGNNWWAYRDGDAYKFQQFPERPQMSGAVSSIPDQVIKPGKRPVVINGKTFKPKEELAVLGHFQQGPFGDCYYLSGNVAIWNTEKGKQILRDTIGQNIIGNVRVQFKGDPTRQVFYLNLALLSSPSTGSPVMGIFEEAAQQLARTSAFKSLPDPLLPENMGNGGYPEKTITLLTGQRDFRKIQTEAPEGYWTGFDANSFQDFIAKVSPQSYTQNVTITVPGAKKPTVFDVLFVDHENQKILFKPYASSEAPQDMSLKEFAAKYMNQPDVTIETRSTSTFVKNLLPNEDGSKPAIVVSTEINGAGTESWHAISIPDSTLVKTTDGSVDPFKSTVTYINPWDTEKPVTKPLVTFWNDYMGNPGNYASTIKIAPPSPVDATVDEAGVRKMVAAQWAGWKEKTKEIPRLDISRDVIRSQPAIIEEEHTKTVLPKTKTKVVPLWGVYTPTG